MANDYLRYALFWDITLFYIIYQKNADLIYIMEEAWNHANDYYWLCNLLESVLYILLICDKSVTTQNLTFLSY